MSTKKKLEQLSVITPLLESSDSRQRYAAWRDVLHLYEDIVARGCKDADLESSAEFTALHALARRAFSALGGMAEPRLTSLRHYDHRRYGPYLGVSDEGRVAERIRDSFLKSPKSLAFGQLDPLVIGCAVDAERLGGAGEVPVGPDEYCDIQLACTGRVLTTTNVGTRMNVRYFNDPPLLTVSLIDEAVAARAALDKAKTLLDPYLHTPNGKPVPVTLYISFTRAVPRHVRLSVLKRLQEKMHHGVIGDPAVHKLGLMLRVPRGEESVKLARSGLDLAAKSGIAEVAVNGVLRREAQERISMPGLLNFFSKSNLNKLWREADAKNIVLYSWKTVDTDSVARNAWTALRAARNAGLYLGKYGMLPLTLPEAEYVIGRIQPWFADWSAAPAIYVDCPTVTRNRCYDVETAEAARLWLDVAHKHNVNVVLIDTADKSKGRKLLRSDASDEAGLLWEDEIRELDAYAGKLGIKALWAGGISAAEAYRFGKMGVFGIYTTTSTARKVAVSGDYQHDPALPNEKEPTYRGVCRVALLLQAGFVQEHLRANGHADAAERIVQEAKAILDVQKENPSEETERSAQRQLSLELRKEWRNLLQDARVGNSN